VTSALWRETGIGDMSPTPDFCISELMTRTVSLAASLAAAVLGLMPMTLSAQETVTLDQAVKETLTHNAALRAAQAGVSEGAEHVTEAKSGWFPRISFTESWQRGDQPVFVFSSLLASRQFTAANFAIDSLNHPDATGFFRGSFGAEQLLFDGGRQRAAVAGAELRRDISQLAVDEAAAGLIPAATQAYGRILTAEAGRRAADTALQAAQEDLARAERRRDVGMATDADVLALAAHAASLRQRAIEHAGDAAVARAELNRLMGAPVDREYQVSEPVRADGVALTKSGLTAALAEADANRPELRRAAAVVRLAEADGKSARTALIPQVAAQAGVDLSGLRFNDRASSWIVGGELRWNLSLGGAELARSRAAMEARARAAAEAEDARAAVHVEVVTAFRRLEAADARQAVGRAAVDQARERQRIIRDRFDAGLAGVTDVLQASSAVTEAEAQRVSAAVDAITSDAMLRRAVGRHLNP
jgi:outer membrane protein TolC